MALAITFKAFASVAGHPGCWQSQMVRSEKPSLFQRLANRSGLILSGILLSGTTLTVTYYACRV